MAQWCARDFIAELSSIEKLVSMRPSSDIQPKLVTQLRDRLVHCRWTADELCSMVQSVGACSLSDISKDTLLKALDDAACPTLASQSQVKLTSNPQTLVQIFNYLSKQDWTRMASFSSWDSTVIMSERLKRCGLTSLKEETKKWATAVIVHLQVQRCSVALTYDQVYYLAEQLHKVFLNTIVKKKASGCTVYPLHPHELGQAFLEQAYDEDTPVRSTSNLLSWNQDKSNKNKVKGGGDEALASLMQRFLQQTVGQVDNNTLHALQLAENASLSAPSTSFVPAPPSSGSGLPASRVCRDSPPAAPILSSEAPEPETSTGAPSKLQAIEDEVFEGLKNSQKRKRCDPKPCKKPAARAQAAAPPAAKKGKEPKLKLGCIRCRGCRTGCSQCQDPGFGGLRLTREEWKEWFELARGKSQAKAKASNKKTVK
ncbi:hypothetical protein AK812_SmicGene21556 [Symbiodinium microadriaticum]|uniref:Uncharacterized protein n=1 Tax=Symbiodinium microadriaticum TaxID=2951 RepID=A0A1Q9DM24_SYMMI|nr:hypothetical protein AK812_SmicGene21556 [Symbiodinium microadriaticum]